MCSRPYSEGKRDGRLTKESWSQWNTLGHLIVLYVRHQTLPVSHGTWPLLAVVNGEYVNMALLGQRRTTKSLLAYLLQFGTWYP